MNAQTLFALGVLGWLIGSAERAAMAAPPRPAPIIPATLTPGEIDVNVECVQDYYSYYFGLNFSHEGCAAMADDILRQSESDVIAQMLKS